MKYERDSIGFYREVENEKFRPIMFDEEDNMVVDTPKTAWQRMISRVKVKTDRTTTKGVK